MNYRFLGFVIILFSIFVLPFWIYIPILFMAVIFFPFFWEGILLGFFVDVVHGSGITSFTSLFPSFAIYVLIALIILLPLRERLRSYV